MECNLCGELCVGADGLVDHYENNHTAEEADVFWHKMDTQHKLFLLAGIVIGNSFALTMGIDEQYPHI